MLQVIIENMENKTFFLHLTFALSTPSLTDQVKRPTLSFWSLKEVTST